MKTHYLVPNASPPPHSSRYSHAVGAAGWLYVTGQLPTDPDDPTGPLVEGIAGQAELCFENLLRIATYAGYSLQDTVFIRIYLKEFDRDFPNFNEVYARHFPATLPLPSRTTLGVAALGRGALVEIDLVCYKS